MAADPYSTLGVPRGASEKEVKSAYRKLAKQLHPDNIANHGDGPAAKAKATERFAEVTRAYDLLSDKDKRAKFDRGEIDGEGNPAGFGGGGFGGGAGPGGFGAGGFGGGGGGFGGQRGFRAEDMSGFSAGAEGVDIGDIFEGLFGGRGGGSPFGGGMGGGTGGGAQFGGARPTPRGSTVQYRLAVSLPDAATRASQRITLPGGNTIELKLPAGLEDGAQMRLAGKGEAGPGGAGDAMVTIAIEPHAFFRREGDNIRLDLPITLDEAVNGAKIKVPTVEGAVMLAVAPGTGSGKVLRLKGKGFTRKDGTRGDQLVTLDVALPEGDADLARRLEGWRDARPLRARFGV